MLLSRGLVASLCPWYFFIPCTSLPCGSTGIHRSKDTGIHHSKGVDSFGIGGWQRLGEAGRGVAGMRCFCGPIDVWSVCEKALKPKK